MSTEHWFDRLAHPHDRRSLLKAAFAAGAAITLPQLRTGISAAAIRDQLPCFKPCLEASYNAWRQERDGCRTKFNVQGGANLFSWYLTQGGAGAVAWEWAYAFNNLGLAGCLSMAELHWRRNTVNCQGSQCGDPVKYPGGAAPGKPQGQCPYVEQVWCGDSCCDISNGKAECCHCSSGTDKCAAVGTCETACR